MTKSKALVLAGLTLWPFIFPLLGLLFELLGLIPTTSSEVPLSFILLMGLLCLTAIEILALLVFYLNYLFLMTPLPLEHKLIWAIALVIGHVVVMPVFWYLFIWKPRTYSPLKVESKFSLVAFVPLLLLLLLPLMFLVPLALLFTPAMIMNEFPKGMLVVAIQWVWVLAPMLGALTIFWIGRWFFRRYNQPSLPGSAWLLLWGVFSIIAFPVLWYDLTILTEMIPSDAAPGSILAMMRFAALAVVLVQPLILGWLYVVSRTLSRLSPALVTPVSIA